MPVSTFLPFDHVLFHAAISAVAALIATALSLPARALHGLHTYIHPDNLAAGDGLRAAIRRPDAPAPAGDLKRRHRSKDHRPDFDEANAQLFRLRLVDSHLHTRLFFPDYRAAFVSSAFALPFLALRHLDPTPSAAATPALAALVAVAHLLFSLAKAAVERSASRRSEKQLGILSGIISYLVALLIAFPLSPSVFDFQFGSTEAGFTKVATAAVAGFLAGLLFMPAARAARSFWLGTDQLRWNLSVVSGGALSRMLLHAALLLNVFAPLLWINPLVAAVAPTAEDQSSGFKEFRVWALMAAAISQLLVLRPNLQMYLNEAVLCWYQRLHASREPDLDYGRAKVFLHNHYLGLAVLQFFAPPVLALLLLGLSELRGNLFSGVLFLGYLVDCSALVKEMALFMAWWTVFAWAVLTALSLALYRFGFLFIS